MTETPRSDLFHSGHVDLPGVKVAVTISGFSFMAFCIIRVKLLVHPTLENNWSKILARFVFESDIRTRTIMATGNKMKIACLVIETEIPNMDCP